MPRTKIDYSNTSIYKICCKDLNITDLYIGHTTDMRKRKNSHKSNCNNEKSKLYNFNVYQFIRANEGWDNWDMIEVEKYNAIDGYDAKKRERYWIEELKASLNSCIPTRTDKEWHKKNYEENPEKIKERQKKYCEENKEKEKERQKKYYEENPEKVKERQKKYREKNAEKEKERQKKYREENAEKIKEKNKEKIICICGCQIRKDYLSRHLKSKKHQDLLNNLKLE